jgi:transposase
LKLRPVHLASPLEPNVDVKILHAKIGELTLENDFLSGALGKAGLLASARK